MIRNKKQGLFLLMGAVFLFLSACSGEWSQTDTQNALNTALRNSLNARIYYWKETHTQGKTVTTRAVNVLADTQSSGAYEVITDGAGNPQNLHITVQEKRNNQLLLEVWCGSSPGKDAQDAPQDFYMEKRYDGKGVVTAKSRKALSAAAYLQSQEFAPYSLKERLAELQGLTVQDMDFESPKAGVTKMGIVTTLQFTLKPEYLERYERENGKPSLFAGANRVSLELTQERISNITLFVQEDAQSITQKNLLSVEAEGYKLEIVYRGPNFTLPKYNDDVTNANETLAWKDAE